MALKRIIKVVIIGGTHLYKELGVAETRKNAKL